MIFDNILSLRRTDFFIQYINILLFKCCLHFNILFFYFRLQDLLQEISNVSPEGGKTIIFVETKKKVESITKTIRRYGWPAVCIHGDKSQLERDFVLTGLLIYIYMYIYSDDIFITLFI